MAELLNISSGEFNIRRKDKVLTLYFYDSPLSMIENKGKYEIITIDTYALNLSRKVSLQVYKFLQDNVKTLRVAVFNKAVIRNLIKFGGMYQRDLS